MIDQKKLEDILASLDDGDIKRIKKLSASKITLWRHCPLAFFQRYVAHERVPDDIRLAFGKSIHYFLNQFYEKNYKTPDSFANSWSWYWRRFISGEGIQDKKILEVLTKKKFPTFRQRPKDLDNPTEEEGFLEMGSHISFGHYVEDGRTYLEENGVMGRHPKANIMFGYMSLGRSMLRRFFERHKGKEPPFIREKRFDLDLFGHDVIVIFDRVDKWPDGRWTITDYKTNKHPPGEFEFPRNVQFTLYSYAARKLFEKELGGEEKAMYHYHLRDGRIFETHRSQDDFVYLEKLLEDTAEGIDRALKTGNFVPYYSWKCPSCDFVSPCSKYSPHHGGPRILTDNKTFRTLTFEGWEDLVEASNVVDSGE